MVCAAGEPKRGPLSCLLCPSTRALGAKRPKPDIIYLKNIKIFRPVDPKKIIFFNREFLKILCFIHISSSIAPWVLRLYPKSVQIVPSYGQIHTFHLPTSGGFELTWIPTNSPPGAKAGRTTPRSQHTLPPLGMSLSWLLRVCL